MVQTKSMATSLEHQESGNAFSYPNCAPAPPSSSVQQQLQSMVVTLVDLTQQNQELTREVNRQRWQRRTKEHGQNSGNEGAKNGVEGRDQPRGTITQRVPHLEGEIDQMKKAMQEMKDSKRRVNHMGDLVHKTNSPFTASITSHPLPSKFKMPTLDSYDGTQNPYDHIATFKTTVKSCAKPFLLCWKA